MMCCGCWEEAGSPVVVNERVLAALRLVETVYVYNSAGGGGHIVFDDNNTGDESVARCLGWIDGDGRNAMDSDAEYEATKAALLAFQALTEDERDSVLAIRNGCFDPHNVDPSIEPGAARRIADEVDAEFMNKDAAQRIAEWAKEANGATFIFEFSEGDKQRMKDDSEKLRVYLAKLTSGN